MELTNKSEGREGWICPQCLERLVRIEGSWQCSNRHTYDIAKEGYVNFLTGKGFKGIQGDSIDMITSRSNFFATDNYDHLRAKLIEIARSNDSRAILDVGCGEGYYIGGLQDALPESETFGTDVSKPAIKAASKKYTATQFAIADTNNPLPLRDESIDLLINVFAPRNLSEFERVLIKQGKVVVVIPGDGHLVELRDRFKMLSIQADKQQLLLNQFDHFRLDVIQELDYTMLLDAKEVSYLINMTPSARAFSDSIAFDGKINVSANFKMLTFSKNPDNMNSRILE